MVGYDGLLGMAVLGFVIDTGALFAPWAFVMFPAYVSYYVSRVPRRRIRIDSHRYV
jgi:hypothetical protein